MAQIRMLVLTLPINSSLAQQGMAWHGLNENADADPYYQLFTCTARHGMAPMRTLVLALTINSSLAQQGKAWPE